jgi:STE24 endopeptidase
VSKFRLGAVCLAVVAVALTLQSAHAAQTATPDAQPQSQSAAAPAPAASAQINKVTAYTLPPDLYKKARERSQINFHLALIGFLYGLVVLLLLLRWGVPAGYRNWAEKVSSRRFLQALVFAPLLLLTIAILTLPLDVYSEIVEKRFGISVQGWGSWTWDWIKGELISLIVGTIFVWLLYIVIRRSPRRWWFYFWLITLPIGVFLFFIGPWVIDPLFHKFAPCYNSRTPLSLPLSSRWSSMLEKTFRRNACSGWERAKIQLCSTPMSPASAVQSGSLCGTPPLPK